MELIRANYPEKEFPSKTELPYILGKCYVKSGDYEKAIANYEEGVRKYPHDRLSPRAAYRIGMIYMERKDPNEALYWFAEQRRLYPDDLNSSRALQLMGLTYQRQLSDYGRAAEIFERYIEQYVEEHRSGISLWQCYTSLAQCYAKLGRTEDALATLRTAEATVPKERLRQEFADQILKLQEGGAK